MGVKGSPYDTSSDSLHLQLSKVSWIQTFPKTEDTQGSKISIKCTGLLFSASPAPLKTGLQSAANPMYSGRGSHSALDLYDKVHFQGNVLVFPSVTKEHRGTYYCVATNVVSRGRGRRGEGAE